MPLTIYRRHNPRKCSSRDSQHCSNKRRPCPIWVRGSKLDGTYIREPLKYRDWTKAQDVLREMEVTGRLPKVIPSAEDRRTTIETWRDRFLENARTENISEETLRKYRLLFKQLLAFAQETGNPVCSRIGSAYPARFPDDVEGQAALEIQETGTAAQCFQVCRSSQMDRGKPSPSVGKDQG